MNKQQLQDFCHRYFAATGCNILHEEPEFIQVELTIDIDKELTDRPYYWLWVEATGEEVKPTVLNLAFSSNKQVEGIESAELVVLGSYRLNQLFESAKKRGQFTLQYHSVRDGELEPYFVISGKLSFLADRRCDEIISYGINMINGERVPRFFPSIMHLPMSPQPPEGCHIKEVRLSFREAWEKFLEATAEKLGAHNHEWAEEAEEHLKQEIEQLETYYGSLLIDNEEEATVITAEKELRLAELKWRYQPRVEFVPFHIGLIYLRKQDVIA
ncbi:hypothetical protein DNHGIG_01260 [Collibacillus ludicampi]|uniref:YqhG n=1 Tax=Collibacillus ludicampi TaxID=2771369 RepID=A0AAV4LAR4_9BACL|nr:YqhG family protein [Collibacillus ludicampi]GIM44577.1 hypothetical protein DNHGIG_01260 [Collibacillus ludicampi]